LAHKDQIAETSAATQAVGKHGMNKLKPLPAMTNSQHLQYLDTMQPLTSSSFNSGTLSRVVIYPVVPTQGDHLHKSQQERCTGQSLQQHFVLLHVHYHSAGACLR
jgi:hypothetical protein